MRRLGVLAAVCCLVAVPTGSAAQSRVSAGVFSGFAFDACSAPSSNALNAWKASPYRALGVYIGGTNRACRQSNLTATWVQSTLSTGWSLLPLYVGLQAPCVGQSGLATLSTNVSTAAGQGRAAADDAAAQASSLGLPAGSPVWFDMEGYKLGDATCTSAVQSFVASWTNELHARGLVSGVYGSAASTIRDVAAIPAGKPDVVWIANWNGSQSVFGDPYIPDSEWANHQRVHQYKGGHKETYGGVTIDIDSSVVDSTVVGGAISPVPPPQPPTVGSVNSGDSLATATWPAAAFTTAVAVTLTPMQTPPAPNGYGVQLTAVETDNQAPIDGFGAPVVVHLLKPPAGLEPAFSSDGVTWTPVPLLTSAGLQGQTLTGYTLAADGTVEFQTLVSGYFGLIADTTPPTQVTATGRLLPSGLYLRWPPAADEGGVASYTVLRNGLPIQTLTPAARGAVVRTPGYGLGRQTVYRVQATDVAGNASAPSRPVVVLRKPRPVNLPRAIPHWAYGLLAYQRGAGPRPKTAPKRPPAWYWAWAAWRTMPYRLR